MSMFCAPRAYVVTLGGRKRNVESSRAFKLDSDACLVRPASLGEWWPEGVAALYLSVAFYQCQ